MMVRTLVPGTVVVECQQGSDEWKAARAGVITASVFKVARMRTGGLDERQAKFVAAVQDGMSHAAAASEAGYKSIPKSETILAALRGERTDKPADVAKKLAFRLAIERISKIPLDEGFETWAIRRGHELEPEARLRHQQEINEEVQTCGIVVTDDWVFGASADGLIGEDGGAEYKCLVSPDSLMPVLLDDDIREFLDQVQGCMWLTGRKWWDFCLYCPALQDVGRDLTRLRILRDDDYIDKMVADLLVFKELVDQYETKLRRADWQSPKEKLLAEANAMLAASA